MSLLKYAVRAEPKIYDEMTFTLIDEGKRYQPTIAAGLSFDNANWLRRGLDAENVIARLVANFPGLCPVDAEEDNVNGADLVEWLAQEIHALYIESPTWRTVINDRVRNGSPEDEG